jgi:hypothetical protein
MKKISIQTSLVMILIYPGENWMMKMKILVKKMRKIIIIVLAAITIMNLTKIMESKNSDFANK